jgi:hypothetical protein
LPRHMWRGDFRGTLGTRASWRRRFRLLTSRANGLQRRCGCTHESPHSRHLTTALLAAIQPVEVVTVYDMTGIRCRSTAAGVQGLSVRPSGNWHATADFGRRRPKGTSSSLRLAPSARNPLANAVSECEANDQNDCDFRHWESRPRLQVAALTPTQEA